MDLLLFFPIPGQGVFVHNNQKKKKNMQEQQRKQHQQEQVEEVLSRRLVGDDDAEKLGTLTTPSHSDDPWKSHWTKPLSGAFFHYWLRERKKMIVTSVSRQIMHTFFFLSSLLWDVSSMECEAWKNEIRERRRRKRLQKERRKDPFMNWAASIFPSTE